MDAPNPTSKLIQLRSLALGNQIVLQLAVPALFIFRSDLNQYGIWLAVNSYASLITFLDLGLFAVIPTNAVVASKRNLTSRDRLNLVAMRKFSMGISSCGIFLLLLILFFGRFSDLELLRLEFFQLTLLAAINTFLNLALRYYEASFRCVNSAYGFAVLTFHAISTTLSTITILYFKGTIFEILITNLVISVAFLLHYRIKGDSFDTFQTPQFYVFKILKRFLRAGIAYQLFPVGYMLLNQGIIIVIQLVGNYEVLGQLGAIRVIAGVFRQISSVFIASSIPHLSLLFKSNKFEEARVRFDNMKRIVYLINSLILLVLILVLLSNLIYGNFAIKEIPIYLWLLFIISSAFDIPWNVWLILPLSVNRHTDLGLRFLFSSFLTLVLTIPAYSYLGLAGVAIALLIQDLVMTKQSIRHGKQILGQT